MRMRILLLLDKAGSSVSRAVLGNVFCEATRGWIRESILMEHSLNDVADRVRAGVETFTGNRQKIRRGRQKFLSATLVCRNFLQA